MNNQPISKKEHNRNGINRPYLITEIFDTIQGEGPWTGVPCTFIRMAGCNLQCTWCDTDYSSKLLLHVVDIMAMVKYQHVVITGGEPFRQNITPLVHRLHAAKKLVQIETNGTLVPPMFPWDKALVICSPKTRVCREMQLLCQHWKFVVDADTEYLFIEPTQPNGSHRPQLPDYVLDRSNVYVMPLTEENEARNKANLDNAVRICIRYGFRLSFRLHIHLGLR